MSIRMVQRNIEKAITFYADLFYITPTIAFPRHCKESHGINFLWSWTHYAKLRVISRNCHREWWLYMSPGIIDMAQQSQAKKYWSQCEGYCFVCEVICKESVVCRRVTQNSYVLMILLLSSEGTKTKLPSNQWYTSELMDKVTNSYI